MRSGVASAPPHSSRGRHRSLHAGCISMRPILIVNPGVGLLEAHSKRNSRFPIEIFLDQGVIAVSSVDAPRSRQIVPAHQFDPRDLLDDVDELIDGDGLTRSK